MARLIRLKRVNHMRPTPPAWKHAVEWKSLDVHACWARGLATHGDEERRVLSFDQGIAAVEELPEQNHHHDEMK